MPTEVPIACSLSADQMRERMSAASRLGRGLLDLTTEGASARLRFIDDLETRAEIDRFVAAESLCCPFFRFERMDEDDATVLRIAAPEDAIPLLRGLLAGIVAGWEMPV